MALTRKMLGAMGIEPEKIDQIIESHAESLEGLKKEAEELRAKAEQAAALEKKVQELEAAKPTEDWEAKYADLSGQFEAYKAQMAAEKADAEKARLYRAVLREAGIDEKRIDAIMRVTDLSGVAVTDGALADAEGIKSKVAEEWAAFIPQLQEQGAKVATPPTVQTGNGGANPEVVKRLQERHERIYGTEDNQTKE